MTLSLDGPWSFRRVDHPDEVTPDMLVGPVPGSTVVVPGDWTLQGMVDVPQYLNITMPFEGPPPQLPDEIPTAVYRRSMTVPTDWLSRQVVLCVGGASSVHAVFVDGGFVGYGTDARLESDFDLTPALVTAAAHSEGRSSGEVTVELAIVVLRYSAQSYLEDQDCWWMGGLHRSVRLEARPVVRLADVGVHGDLDPASGIGTITVDAHVDAVDRLGPGWTVRARLEEPSGRTGRHRPQTAVVPHRHAVPYVFSGHRVEMSWTLTRCAPWSAETPNLYRVLVELLDTSGEVVDEVVVRTGCRRVEVRDRQLLVNGQPIWIDGVNRHDIHPDRGTAVTRDDMLDDLLAMRRHNITAVRTAHYPNSPEFYDLCDEIGMYVVDEADIEGHAYNHLLCSDDAYRAAFLERGVRMVQRDRNHPSIILWSLGNETGYGTNHDALAGAIRALDPTRPLHYEGVVSMRPVTDWASRGRVATDVVCPMYAPIADIVAYARSGAGDRPLILCEYSHAMGNSNGDIAEYARAFAEERGLQGGFIWEWKDHALRRHLADGGVCLAVGGDFGDEPNDGNFVADGLMSADLEPHPALAEVAWIYRPVVVTATPGGRRLVIRSRRSFTDLSDLRARFELLVDGVVEERGTLDPPPIAPLSTVTIPLPCRLPRHGTEVYLTVTWEQRRATRWAPAGHLCSWDQVALRRAGPAEPVAAPRRTDEDPLAPLLTRPIGLSLWRAPIDNDGFKLMPELSERIGVGGRTMTAWKRLGFPEVDPETLAEHRHRIVAEADRSVLHHHVVTVTDDDLARVGVRFGLPARFTRQRWYGRGPHENYPDRAASALVGVWEGDLDEMPYLIPQEFGLRTEVRWFELVDPSTGESVTIEAVEPGSLHVSATRYTDEMLYAAGNVADLEPAEDVNVHIDVAHRGLGTASCGPDTLPAHRLAAGRYRFAYRIVHRTAPTPRGRR